MSDLSQNDLPENHFRITVTSTENPTYAELKKAYDWVATVDNGHDPCPWDDSKYKLELHVSLRELTPSTGYKVVFLKKFDRSTTSEKAIEWAKSHGYRLAFPFEREAFAREAFTKADPDQLDIVDLGSFIVIDGALCVPILAVYDTSENLDLEDDEREGFVERVLDNRWPDDGQYANCRFLFVRE